MSSLLQSTGSSPSVLVHIVGPLAAILSRTASFFLMRLSCVSVQRYLCKTLAEMFKLVKNGKIH